MVEVRDRAVTAVPAELLGERLERELAGGSRFVMIVGLDERGVGRG